MAPEFGPSMPPEEEKQMLQDQVAFLKDQMDQISKRIEDLEKESEEKS
jgi:ubiquinone biosynthesis protein UbiJ